MNKAVFLGAVLIAVTAGSAGVNAENADMLPTGKTYTVNGVSFTMITIPVVTDGTLGYGEYDVTPAHTVSLPAYRIGETEVTQELWWAVMGSNPSEFTDSVKNPVEQVSWYECIKFCNELAAEIMGEEHCVYTIRGSSVTADFSQKGFRLSTEAEWGICGDHAELCRFVPAGADRIR